jgi:magnesium-transporting ATPase (P-type)
LRLSLEISGCPKVGSKIDLGLLDFVREMGVSINKYKKQYVNSRSVVFPFTPTRKRMSTILENVSNGFIAQRRLHLNGSAELVLESCSKLHALSQNEIVTITPEMRASIEADLRKMKEEEAHQVIGIAYKDLIGKEVLQNVDSDDVHAVEKEGLTLIGFLELEDGSRQLVKEAVNKLREAEVKVITITESNKTCS